MSTLEGLLLVDKPAGPTSHEVVEVIRSFAPGLRVGHTGTLDPSATGLLAVCLGRTTRLARFLAAARKLYSGTIRLGVITDTYDAAGRIVEQRPLAGVDEPAVRSAAKRFEGELTQVPPIFSARKVRGRPMHRLARQGRPVTPVPTRVAIHRLEIHEVSDGRVTFTAETSAGTYIRSLAHDLGEALGCGGHLESLRRLASGGLRIEQAHTLEEIRSRGERGTLAESVLPLDSLELGLPVVVVTPDGAAAMTHGRLLSGPLLTRGAALPLPTATCVRIEDQAGHLLGVARAEASEAGLAYHPEVVLAG